MEFLKVHGAGNDFVLLPDLGDDLQLTAKLTILLCDRHRGIGADGVIRLAPPRIGVDADVFMDYRNADGGIAEMCGNGVRCVAKYVADRRGLDRVRVDTRAGVKEVTVERGADGRVVAASVDMGVPVVGDREVVLDAAGTKVAVTTVSLGNPHAVIVVDDPAAAPVTLVGPALEHHPRFPRGTNVEFIAVPARDRVRGRIWERGVGETLASGTGAAAMAAAAMALGHADADVTVELPGGNLRATWDGSTTIVVSGPAVEVATGTLDLGALA